MMKIRRDARVPVAQFKNWRGSSRGNAGSLLGLLGSLLALLLTVTLFVPAAMSADRDLLVGTMPWDGAVNQGGIQRFDGITGAFLGYFVLPGDHGLNYPFYFTFGPDGNLYVTDAARVIRYSGTTGLYIDDFVTSGTGGIALFPA